MKDRVAVHNLVSWYFELSQPQRITSRLKTMFNLSPIYFACKSSNHELSKNHKISPDTKLHKTKYTKTSKKFVEELVPLVSPLLKQHIRLGHIGTVDHSVNLHKTKCTQTSNTQFSKNWPLRYHPCLNNQRRLHHG